MHFTKKNSSQKREDLRNKLKKEKILKFPGAYNPLTAKLIEEIGFDGVYISGAVMANDLGIPDIGITTLKEVSYRANQISRVSDLPCIVDADTGFSNCQKTIEIFENLGGKAIYFGKPYREIYLSCLDMNKRTLVIGDNLNTDIKGANNMKLDSLFITSGIHKSKIKNDEDIEKLLKKHNVSTNYFQSDLTW